MECRNCIQHIAAMDNRFSLPKMLLVETNKMIGLLPIEAPLCDTPPCEQCFPFRFLQEKVSWRTILREISIKDIEVKILLMQKLLPHAVVDREMHTLLKIFAVGNQLVAGIARQIVSEMSFIESSSQKIRSYAIYTPGEENSPY